MPQQVLLRVMLWAVGAGFVGAHLMAIGVYAPGLLVRQPWVLLPVWQGLSSFGGFLGGLIGVAIACRRFRERRLELADILLQGLVVGWVFGRLGCAIAHDHLGPLTSFFLGVSAPGGARRDLGLEEFLFTAAVLLPAVLLALRKASPGGCTALVALLYAPYRFASDFLRTADTRYGGLTPAQVGSIALCCYGIWMSFRLLTRGVRAPRCAPGPAVPPGGLEVQAKWAG